MDIEQGIEKKFNPEVSEIIDYNDFTIIESILKHEETPLLGPAVQIFEQYAPTYMNKSTFVGTYILEEDLIEKIEHDVNEFFKKQAFKHSKIEESLSKKLEETKGAKAESFYYNEEAIYEKNSNNEIIGGVGGIQARYKLTEKEKKINVFIEQHYYYFPTIEKYRNALLEIKETHQVGEKVPFTPGLLV